MSDVSEAETVSEQGDYRPDEGMEAETSHAHIESAPLQRQEIGPGSLVWAKLSRYPWWPALVLERDDSRIPKEERRSTKTSTPVLFFGSADFAWIDASRNVSPWDVEKESRSLKDKTVDFKRALLEAAEYAESGELPPSFNIDPLQQQLHEQPLAAAKPPPKRPSQGAGKKSLPPPQPYTMLTGSDLQLGPHERRRLTVKRYLGLAPPVNSPAASQPVVNPNLGPLLQEALLFTGH